MPVYRNIEKLGFVVIAFRCRALQFSSHPHSIVHECGLCVLTAVNLDMWMVVSLEDWVRICSFRNGLLPVCTCYLRWNQLKSVDRADQRRQDGPAETEIGASERESISRSVMRSKAIMATALTIQRTVSSFGTDNTQPIEVFQSTHRQYNDTRTKLVDPPHVPCV